MKLFEIHVPRNMLGRLCCNNHALIEFVIQRNIGLAKSVVRTLNFRRAKFQLLKELLDEISCVAVLREKGIKS